MQGPLLLSVEQWGPLPPSVDALYYIVSFGSLTREAPARAGPSREDGQDAFGFPSRVPDYRRRGHAGMV
jgi:hypothetical protein